ncbi:MAG: shikimate dehydrogenase [Candidatus Roizmanbacteria bacterium]
MKTARTKICLIIGDPVSHSLSPLMHNTAYEAVGLGEEFVYLAAQVKVEKIKETVEAVRTLGIRGLTCTVPHKTAVILYLDMVDETAQKIGAVNTIVNDQGHLIGYNTDWIGAITPLKQRGDLRGKNVLVIGAGGAARAIVYGLMHEKAHVTIVNRTAERARALADEFHCLWIDNASNDFISSQDIIINATSIGMHPHIVEVPIQTCSIHRAQILMDIVYVPHETEFLRQGKSKGATIIYGVEMLLHQGIAQFELYTGVPAPVDTMSETLKNALHI